MVNGPIIAGMIVLNVMQEDKKTKRKLDIAGKYSIHLLLKTVLH
jgi:hypothetical protein